MLSSILATWHVPITVGMAILASLAYAISVTRRRERQLGAMDCLTIVALMIAISIATIPVLESAAEGAKRSAALQNLQAFRGQIELYRLQHGCEAPLLYNGTFPQLTEATNAKGVPGPRGSEYPYGPYFPAGLPTNPVTGKTVVTAVEEFPPTQASGNGGWLYHSATGQVALDLPDLLDR